MVSSPFVVFWMLGIDMVLVLRLREGVMHIMSLRLVLSFYSLPLASVSFLM
jgi:hypothetical protein